MACDTISISGKMFVTGSGRSVTRFMVRGVALSSNLDILPGYDDLLAEEHYTYLDEIILPTLRALNVNVVRLYSVDPTKSHQKAMASLEAANKPTSPTCATLQVAGGLPLSIQYVTSSNEWDQVCGVAANTLKDGDTVSNAVQWGSACLIS